MKVLSKAIHALWNDKNEMSKIGRKSKTIFLREFKAYFACNTTDRFYDIINQDVEPDKVEEDFIVKGVVALWRRSNPLADIEQVMAMHEAADKPIIKRFEQIRLLKSQKSNIRL